MALRKLTPLVISLMLGFVFANMISEKEIFAYSKSSQKKSSWDMRRRSEEQKHYTGDHEISVSKKGVVRLKKSTFFNKRPFQFTTPVYSDSMIFVGVDAGFFYGLDADHIKKKWEYKTAGPVQASAAVGDGVVYFGDTDNYAYALNASDGHEIWKVQLDSSTLAAPLVMGGRVYFVTENGRLTALDQASGKETLKTEPVDRPVGFTVRKASTPVYTNGLILFGTSSGVLLAYRENGSIAWVKQLGDRQSLVYDIDTTPLIWNNRIYITLADEKVFCLDISSGTVLWSNDEFGGSNDLQISNDKLYVSGGGVLAALDPENGDPLWTEDFETPEISSPAVMDKVIAVISTKDKLYFVDAQTGDKLYERFIKKGSFGDPIFVDNNLYLLSNAGRLFAFQVKEKTKKSKK